MQVLVNTLSKTPSTKNNHSTPSAMKRYITQHYKTPILGSSYSYLLQALSNVLILLSFLLFPITTAIPISLQYLVQYILWRLPQQSSVSVPCSYNTSVLSTGHSQTQPIRTVNSPNHSDWFREEHVQRFASIKVNLMICSMIEEETK